MSQTFPTGIPSYPDTGGSEVLGSAGGGVGLSRILDDYGLDIAALATKMGTGSSTPSSNKVLRSTGAGVSSWGAVDLTTDVTGVLPVANGGTGISSLGSGVATFLGTPSSANLRGAVTDETGTGALVFADSPTILTPTIASFTNAQHDHGDADDGGQLVTNSLPAGVVVQSVAGVSTAVNTGAGTIPIDNTIPQNTEGDQYMSLDFTPLYSSSTLHISITAMLSSSAALQITGALFTDSNANALSATAVRNTAATEINTLHLFHAMAAGTTSQITFKFRAGGSAAGTTTFNGSGGTRAYGAITHSSIVVTEIKG